MLSSRDLEFESEKSTVPQMMGVSTVMEEAAVVVEWASTDGRDATAGDSGGGRGGRGGSSAAGIAAAVLVFPGLPALPVFFLEKVKRGKATS